MVKVKGPLFSLGAKGSLGRAISYRKQPFGAQVEKKPKKRDLKSASQLSRRGLFLGAVGYWNSLSDEEQAAYRGLAAGLPMTGFNLCVQDYLMGRIAVGVDVEEGGTPKVAAATALNFGVSDFAVTDEGGKKAGIALDYTNSKIARKDQNEVVSGQWRFSDGAVGLRFGSDTGPTLKGSGDTLALAGLLSVSGVVTSISGAPKALGGQVVLYPSAHGSASAYGLYFGAQKWGAYNVAGVTGLYAYAQAAPGSGGIITAQRAAYLSHILSGSPTINLLQGLLIAEPSVYSWGGSIPLYEALNIGDFTTPDTTRLIQAGPTVPYLRLLGGGNPASNETNLYLKEGLNLRHVQVMDPGVGGANFVGGERVAILA